MDLRPSITLKVSIHAPVGGATRGSGASNDKVLFQSTRLWEARRVLGIDQRLAPRFNPRACGRRDFSRKSSFNDFIAFQSTRLWEARLFRN